MTHINQEIEKYFKTINVDGEQQIVYDIERLSKNKKYKATFKGMLKIEKVQ